MSTPLTDEWIDEQLKLCEAATEGPWEHYADEVIEYSNSHTICAFLQSALPRVERMNNAAFIAAAREGYVKVLLVLRSLRKEVVQCPCCTEFYIEKQGEDGLCPECNRMQGGFNG